LAGYLTVGQYLPVERASELLGEVLGAPVATGTLAAITAEGVAGLGGFAERVRTLLAGAEVAHFDESGARVAGRLHWVHSASDARLSWFSVHPRRGAAAMDDAGSLPGLHGVAVHDGWAPYWGYDQATHALCNAHHLRELKALVEIEKEDWARRLQRLLRVACHVTNLAREANVPLKPGLIALIEQRYDAIIAAGMAFHEAQPTVGKPGKCGRAPRRVGHNLLLRLLTRRQDVLRFLTNLTVPFTNNLAEQDGRMMKVQQKVSGGFRSEDGAKNFAIIRSVLSTARKQGWSLIDTLMRDPFGLIGRLRLA
jgi:transposase